MDTVSVVQKHVIVDRIALREPRVGRYESIWPKKKKTASTHPVYFKDSGIISYGYKNVDIEWSSLSCRKRYIPIKLRYM